MLASFVCWFKPNAIFIKRNVALPQHREKKQK